MKEKKSNKIVWLVGSATLSVIGIMVIPVLITKFGNKLYKSSLKKDEIDFDGLGPEIVKKK